MNMTPSTCNQKTSNNQPSILGFVNCPNYTTAKTRLSWSNKRSSKDLPHLRGSSSQSVSRKCKPSSGQLSNNIAKKQNMEVDKDTSVPPVVPSPPTPAPPNPYTAALLDMEARLTPTMKEMLEPLKTDINSLVLSQKEWEQQKTEVRNLHVKRERLNLKIKEVEEKNCKLEDRVKKLEDKLMESNLIIHRIKESSWELDSTRNELVVQAIASTVHADNDSSKLEIARKIPISSTKCIGRYNPLRSRPIWIMFARKSDAELLLERKKKLH